MTLKGTSVHFEANKFDGVDGRAIEDFETKVARLRRLCIAKEVDGALVVSVANFGWLTSGRVNVMSRRATVGDVGIYVTTDEVYLVTNSIEAPRQIERDLQGFTFREWIFPWYQSIAEQVGKLPGKVKGADIPLVSTVNLASDITQLHFPMTAYEMERYLVLGHESATAVERTVMEFKPGISGVDMTARVDQALTQSNIYPIVTLVGADDPYFRYRHPLPTTAPFRDSAMVISCAMREGLIVAFTRTIQRDNDENRNRQFDVQCINAQIVTHTRPGRALRDVFTDIQTIYVHNGYPDQWKSHHQGGPLGYETRYLLATPNCSGTVQARQAYAWNPSIPGYKAEDTFLITETSPALVTRGSSTWPYTVTKVNGATVEQADTLYI